MMTISTAANAGHVLLSDIANPVVEIELTTWKIPFMIESPQENSDPFIFNDIAIITEAITIISV